MWRNKRRTSRWIEVLAAVLLSAAPAVTLAQVPLNNQATPTGAPTAPPAVLQEVGVDQKLDEQIPPDITFRDETGKTVRIGDYFNKGKPILLTPVYYECPMLCTMTLNGVVKAMRSLSLDAGKDYEVVTFSFDPNEGPELAAKKRANYLKIYNRPGAESGWHFLTGSPDSIQRLTRAIGFRYTYDKNSQQFAHASSVMILTPQGKLSRYFYGLEYSNRDMRLGLVEASEGKVGSVVDSVLLLCFHYDPAQGKYGPRVMMIIRIGGLVTLAMVGGFIAFQLRRERRGRNVPENLEKESTTASVT